MLQKFYTKKKKLKIGSDSTGTSAVFGYKSVKDSAIKESDLSVGTSG